MAISPWNLSASTFMMLAIAPSRLITSRNFPTDPSLFRMEPWCIAYWLKSRLIGSLSRIAWCEHKKVGMFEIHTFQKYALSCLAYCARSFSICVLVGTAKSFATIVHGAGQLLVFPFGVAWETSPWPWKFPLAFPGHQWSRWLFAVKCVQHVESSCARVQKPICFRPVSQAMCPRQWVSTSVCCAGVAYMCSTLALTCGLEHPVWSCSWSRIPIWAINSIFMSIIDPSFVCPDMWQNSRMIYGQLVLMMVD